MSENIVITVVNELDGKEYELPAGQGVTIGKLIEDVYRKLKREPKSGDRLYCADSKESLLPRSDMKLKEFLALGLCPDLVWSFAGQPGGA